MQPVIVIISWTVFSILFQSAVLPDFPTVRIWTDLLFYLIVLLGLRFNFVSGVIVSLVLGYVADTVSLVPYGVTLISYTLILLFVRQVRANVYLDNKTSLIFWIFIFSIGKCSIQLVLFKIYSINLIFGWSAVGLMFLQSLWCALLGIFIIPFLDKMLSVDWGYVFRRKGLRD